MSEYWTSFAKVLKLIKVCIKVWLSFSWIIEFAQKYSMSLINRLNLIWHFLWLSMMTSLSKFLTVLSSANTIDITLFEMSADSALCFMSFSSLFLMISIKLSYFTFIDGSFDLSWLPRISLELSLLSLNRFMIRLRIRAESSFFLL